MLYRGLRNTEIGRHLSISPRTVEAHVSNIILKLGRRAGPRRCELRPRRGLSGNLSSGVEGALHMVGRAAASCGIHSGTLE